MHTPTDLNVPAILAVLERHKVKYVLIGAYAAIVRGYGRQTQDIDITPLRDIRNLKRLAKALQDLGAREKVNDTDESREVHFDDQVLRMKDTWFLTTRYGNLDLVINPAGLAGYQSLISGKSLENIGGSHVQVASLDDIIRSKEATDRPKDRAALPELRRLRDREAAS